MAAELILNSYYKEPNYVQKSQCSKPVIKLITSTLSKMKYPVNFYLGKKRLEKNAQASTHLFLISKI